jgi:hypothetical protein
VRNKEATLKLWSAFVSEFFDSFSCREPAMSVLALYATFAATEFDLFCGLDEF